MYILSVPYFFAAHFAWGVSRLSLLLEKRGWGGIFAWKTTLSDVA
jgi:hypothetical protein